MEQETTTAPTTWPDYPPGTRLKMNREAAHVVVEFLGPGWGNAVFRGKVLESNGVTTHKVGEERDDFCRSTANWKPEVSA